MAYGTPSAHSEFSSQTATQSKKWSEATLCQLLEEWLSIFLTVGNIYIVLHMHESKTPQNNLFCCVLYSILFPFFPFHFVRLFAALNWFHKLWL